MTLLWRPRVLLCQAATLSEDGPRAHYICFFRQLRDVTICPHEKGIVSYARNYSIVEHDLFTPNAVRSPLLVYAFRRRMFTLFTSLHGDWSNSPSHQTPSPPSFSPKQTTPSWRQAARRLSSISLTTNPPTSRPPHVAHRAGSAGGFGRASTSWNMAQSTTP